MIEFHQFQLFLLILRHSFQGRLTAILQTVSFLEAYLNPCQTL